MIQLGNIIITKLYVNNNIASNIKSKMERIRKSHCQKSIIVGAILHSVNDRSGSKTNQHILEDLKSTIKNFDTMDIIESCTQQLKSTNSIKVYHELLKLNMLYHIANLN